MPYIDLTRTCRAGMPVFLGDPTPAITQIANIETDGFLNYSLTTNMHAGTHIDAPAHMLPGGKRISAYAPEKFFGKGYLVRTQGQKNIDTKLLSHFLCDKNAIVLIATGWGEKFGQQEYFTHYPSISEDFATHLLTLGVSIVGMDTPSPDYESYAVHKLLLAHDVLIIENLTNLDALVPYHDFDITALPAKFDCDSAPVRVIARV